MSDKAPNSYRNLPDDKGRFGIHGGRFVAETLMPLILDVEKSYYEARNDQAFLSELLYYQKHYIGRPSPAIFCRANDRTFWRGKAVFQAR